MKRPRPAPSPERYPGQVLHHSCGFSRAARLTCRPCAIERAFKLAEVIAAQRIPRSPCKLVLMDYRSEDDREIYEKDDRDGWPLQVKTRTPMAVGGLVEVRWARRPRAKKWRLELREVAA